MKRLLTYEIPDEIRNIELQNDIAKLNHFKAIAEEAHTDENAYFASFVAMIQMEEMENSKRLTIYDLENVQLELHSRADQIFQIQFNVNSIDTKDI